MIDKILVINAGSSSLKYRLFSAEETLLASGLIERIGESAGDTPDHGAAVVQMSRRLIADGGLATDEAPGAVGHRVVHGGEAFSAARRIDAAVLDAVRAAVPLAPLHNPANVLGIEFCLGHWPQVPQVAVFDTAFHQTLPPAAFRYALPESLYREQGVRRYGFHGTSHAFVAGRAADYLGQSLARLKLIVLHLGNGASACAIRDGRSIDTSMGMTPLAGLVMGTRTGDLDPGVVLHLLRNGASPAEVDRLLNRDSGLKGLGGVNDMRTVLERANAGDAAAQLAIQVYCHRLKHYIGAYFAVLGGLDALIFTGGIGEHAAPIRAAACDGLEHLGICLDAAANRAAPGGVAEIGAPAGRARILVVPTNEELEIARQTRAVLAASG